eukprot:scaffold6570_cov79-Amphora_coffeaeformis.AAC.2
MRLGQSGKSVAEAQKCAIMRMHQSLKSTYERQARDAVRLQYHQYGGFDSFQKVPDDWLLQPWTLIKAFICDYMLHRADLSLELQGNTVSQSAAADHQRKVVKRVRRQSNELEMAQQSFVITGDLGIVLNYVVVPDTSGTWTNKALNEVASRFDGRRILFVDCNCCNGKLQKPSNIKKKTDNEQPWTDKFVKKLDGWHVCFRMSRECNSEHPRAPLFARQIAQAIYIRDQSCEAALEDARQQAGLTLTDKEKKRDSILYSRRIPGPGYTVAKRLMVVLQAHIKMDMDARQRLEAAGVDCSNVNSAHPGYPLVTNKVKKIVNQQVIHCLNGCLTDEGNLRHIEKGLRNYRNTGIFLQTYASPFGTSRCETLHSVADAAFYTTRGLAPDFFDAKAHWNVIHFNRKKLQDHITTPPLGMAPSEHDATKLVSSEGRPQLHFGFEYCRIVTAEKNHELKQPDSTYDFESLAAMDEPDNLRDILGDESSPFPDNAMLDDLDEQNPDSLLDIDFDIDSVADVSFEEAYDELQRSLAVAAPMPIETPLASRTQAIPAVGAADTEAAANAAEAGADMLATINPEATWCQDIAATTTPKKRISQRKNVYKRRNLGGQIQWFPVMFNRAMHEEWKAIYSHLASLKDVVDRTLIDNMMKEYNKRQLKQMEDNPDMSSGGEPLLSVGRQQAEQWVRQVMKSSGRGFRSGRFSNESIAISDDLTKMLQHTPVPVHFRAPIPVVAQTRRMADASATLRAEKTYVPPLNPTRQICSICKKATGKGPGYAHLRGQCPDETAEAVAKRAVENDKRVERKRKRSEYVAGLEERRQRARKMFKTKGWAEFPPNVVKKGYSKCDVCFYNMPRKKKPSSHDWHLIRHNITEYCPYADGDAKKQDAKKNT